MKFFIGLGRVFDYLNLVMVVISAILLLGLTFIVGADITLRYLFNRPMGWVKEVSEYTLVGMGFLVAAWILRDDGHVKMDLVLNKLKPRAQTLLNIITSIISTIVVLIITWFTLRVILEFYRTKLVIPTVLEPPRWILLTPILVGSFLLAIQFIRRTYSYIGKWKGLTK
ncbi:MAG TPA: TRAP transporter small permease [Syntrophorhabdales bacterium]|nr:TRAP transporter small permease [Syntrophorhabdales bacterium]